MGFLKKDSDFSSGEHFSVVSAECYFQGTLSVQGSLRVDGTLEGSVDNARHVIVGTDGKIVGDVTGKIVVCGLKEMSVPKCWKYWLKPLFKAISAPKK